MSDDARNRISLARLVLEVRRRSNRKLNLVNRQHVDRVLAALKRVADEQAGTEGVVVRLVLEALVGIHRDRDFNGRALDSLSPATIAQLDLVVDAMMDGRVTRDELRSYLRDSLIKVVK